MTFVKKGPNIKYKIHISSFVKIDERECECVGFDIKADPKFDIEVRLQLRKPGNVMKKIG